MQRLATAIWVIAIGAAVGGIVLPARAQERMTRQMWEQREALREVFHVQRVAIESELRALDREALPQDHWAREWAGEYYTSHRGVRFVIAPESGVASQEASCLIGSGDFNYGEIVEVLEDGLRVRLAIDPATERRQIMGERLYFVRWGDWRLLVAERGMMRLVNDINEGGTAREYLFSTLKRYVGEGRADSKPASAPELPERWAKLLLTRPVRLTVASVRKPELATFRGYQWDVEFTGGSADGAYVGLTVTSLHGWGYGEVTLTEVGEHECRGWLVSDTVDRAPLGLDVGKQFVAPIGR